MEEVQEKQLSFLADVIRILKGPFSPALWFCLFLICALTIYVSMYIEYQRKGKKNPVTPPKFSIAYMLFNNFWRWSVGLVVTFFLFRLASMFVSEAWLKNEDLMLAFGMGVGILLSAGIDNAFRVLQDKAGIFKVPNPYIDKVNEIADKVADKTELTPHEVKQIIKE